jgi:hypothetical protein
MPTEILCRTQEEREQQFFYRYGITLQQANDRITAVFNSAVMGDSEKDLELRFD